MRKLLYILVLTIFASSCDLNLEPKNAVTFEHFFRNENDLYAVVAQIHGEMRATFGTVSFQDHMGARIDRILPSASSYDKLRNLDPNTVASRYDAQRWNRYYNVLSLVDLFMDNYKKAVGVPEDRLNFCLGQCYFARSVNYLWLARTWGDAVITKGSKFNGKYAKSPAKAVLDTAINAGLMAYKLLPKHSEMKGAGGRTLTSKQYGCKGSAAGVLAHLYAWKGSMFNDAEALAQAEFWASKLLEKEFEGEIGTYTMLGDPEAVCEKAMRRNSEESVFEIEISYVDSDYPQFLLGSYLVSYPVKNNTGPQDALNTIYGLTLSSVNTLYYGGDKRRTAYFYRPDDSEIANSGELAYLYKWRYPLYREAGGGEPAWFRNFDCNKVIIRLADIYLLRAECRIKLGNTGGAQSDLNVVRLRAGAPLFPDVNREETDAQLQQLIFREREKELLYEGQRYYDVVRNGYERVELSPGFSELSDADISNGALYLPVPRTAFSDNDLMIQNTYWLSKM